MEESLVVGRILRPHGLRGELSVEVRTDDPGERFAVGSVLPTDPPEAGPLTVEASRWHPGLTVVTVSGELVCTVTDVLHPGQDLLAITPARGTSRRAEVLVPFVAAIAVAVDLAGGKLIIDPPPGLLDLGQDGSDGGDLDGRSE